MPSAHALEMERATEKLKAACDALLQALARAGEGDPVYDAAITRTLGNAFSSKPWRRPPADVIASAAQYGQWEDLGPALDTLIDLERPTGLVELRKANKALLEVLELSNEGLESMVTAKMEGLRASRVTLGFPLNDLLK